MSDEVARLIKEARNTQGYSEGDLRSLVRSLANALEGATSKDLETALAENERLVAEISSRIYEREMAKLGRDDAFDQLESARAIINRAHHESIAGDGRSSVVLAVVRDILAEGVTE